MKIYIETYGCQMNEYDSGMIRAMLTARGHAPVSDPAAADVVIVNTCSVRERAERRVLGRLRHLRGLIREDARLGVVGCLAQRLGGELLRTVPGLAFVFGTDQYDRLPAAVGRLQRGSRLVEVAEVPGQSYEERPGPTTASLTEFVAVMRGCDNYCAYCVVPYVRGRERSRRAVSVIAEVEALAARGAREVTLLGQNVNSYTDRDIGFPELLRRADSVGEIARIRFATSHPKDLTDDLIDAVASLPKVCEHVHLPVQSGSDRVLRAMNRSYTREHYVRLARRLRDRIPGVSITTDVIVGFPGETRGDFEETLSLMREVEFDSAFMFSYSPREGTVAASLEDDVPRSEKAERLDEVIELEKRLALGRNEKLTGRTVEVLVEGPSQRDGRMLFGRTRSGKTVVAPGPTELTGRLCDVRITRPGPWTLAGEFA